MQGGNEPLLTGGGANHRFARPSGSETYGQPVRPARSASVSADESDPDAPRASAFMSMDDLSGSMEKTEFRLALFLLVGYIIVGGVAFKFVFPIDPASPTTLSNTTFTDALYFTVVTLTTVGYGDLEPQTPGGRVFTAFFLFLGVGFIATCLGIVVGIIMDAEAAEADSVAKAIQGSPDSDEPEPQPSIDDSWGQIRRKLLFSCFNIVVFITIGTVSFAYIEDHDFIDSFYWCCVTSCTVGYGDLAPITVGGRWFAIFYIAVSTVVIAQALGDVSSIPLEIRRQRQEAKVLSQFGDSLEEDELLALAGGETMVNLGLSAEPGVCTRAEFTLAMLIKLGKINSRDMSLCFNQFSLLDTSGDGRLEMEDVVLAADRRREQKAVEAAAAARG